MLEFGGQRLQRGRSLRNVVQNTVDIALPGLDHRPGAVRRRGKRLHRGVDIAPGRIEIHAVDLVHDLGRRHGEVVEEGDLRRNVGMSRRPRDRFKCQIPFKGYHH